MHSRAATALHRHQGDARLQVLDDVGPAGGAPEGDQDGVWPGRHHHLRVH